MKKQQQTGKTTRRGGSQKMRLFCSHFYLGTLVDSGEKQSSENSYLTRVAFRAREDRNGKNTCHRLGNCQ